jgi:hypothetical protein
MRRSLILITAGLLLPLRSIGAAGIGRGTRLGQRALGCRDAVEPCDRSVDDPPA